MIEFPNAVPHFRVDSHFTSNLYIPIPRPDGSYSFKDLPRHERDSIAAEYKKDVDLYIQSVSGIAVSDQEHANYFGMTFSDEHSSPPPPVFSEKNVKDGISHEDFKRRQKAGEIMMSDYTRASIRVTHSPGLRSNRTDTIFGSLTYEALVAGGVLNLESFGSGKGLLHYKQYVYRANSYFAIPEFAGSYTRLRVRSPIWVTHTPFSAYDVFRSATTQSPPDVSLVTDTVAKANRKSVDVLTAFAELPKTISTLISGFKSVVGYANDFKKRKFNLSRSYASREKRLTDRYKKQIARLDKELSNKKLSHRRRKTLQKHRNDIYVDHRDALRGLADELVNESANLWLNFRYNIMPNVYLAQDVFHAYINFGKQFVTAKGTDRKGRSIEVNSIRIRCDAVSACTIKRRFSQVDANLARSVVSNDLFVTAWELVPLSFVYDWFVNVGNFLSAQSYVSGWEEEKCAWSSKLTLDSIHEPDDPTFVIPPRTEVSGFIYTREIISPSEYCGLVFKPSLGLARQMDAAALSWKAVRSFILLNKRN